MKNGSDEQDLERYYSDMVASYYSSKASAYHEDSGYGSASGIDSELTEYLKQAYEGRRVLEIACGTGYWTRQVAETACEITGMDASRGMLAEAERLNSCSANTAFTHSNAFHLADIPSGYTGAFSVLWWCHIPLGRIREFLNILHSKLLPGARVIHVCQLHDSDKKEHERDSRGNTLAKRFIGDRPVGIVKNIPDESFLRELLKDSAGSIDYYSSDSWWWRVSYTLR